MISLIMNRIKENCPAKIQYITVALTCQLNDNTHTKKNIFNFIATTSYKLY